MASGQQVKTIKCEHKPALDELLMEARNVTLPRHLDDEKFGVAKGKAAIKPQGTTRGAIRNGTPETIVFVDSKDWSGSFVGFYPPNVPHGKARKFCHRGKPPIGSKGAVVYYGTNAQGGPTTCAWVLAWNTPGNGSANQIYVEAGPSFVYPKGDIDWDAIQSNLDASSRESYYKDEDTGAEIDAMITNGHAAELAVIVDV